MTPTTKPGEADLTALMTTVFAGKEVPQVWFKRSDVERIVAAALGTAPATPVPAPGAIKLALDALEILDLRPRPMCRDCADEDGTCPGSGLPCDMRAVISDARAVLATLVQSVPAIEPVAKRGWKLVPIKPTEAMLRAGLDADAYGRENIHSWDDPQAVYRAMLKAAPTSPAPAPANAQTVTNLTHD